MAASDFVNWWVVHRESMAEWDWDAVAAAAWDAAVEFVTSHNPGSPKLPQCEECKLNPICGLHIEYGSCGCINAVRQLSAVA